MPPLFIYINQLRLILNFVFFHFLHTILDGASLKGQWGWFCIYVFFYLLYTIYIVNLLYFCIEWCTAVDRFMHCTPERFLWYLRVLRTMSELGFVPPRITLRLHITSPIFFFTSNVDINSNSNVVPPQDQLTAKHHLRSQNDKYHNLFFDCAVQQVKKIPLDN